MCSCNVKGQGILVSVQVTHLFCVSVCYSWGNVHSCRYPALFRGEPEFHLCPISAPLKHIHTAWTTNSGLHFVIKKTCLRNDAEVSVSWHWERKIGSRPGHPRYPRLHGLLCPRKTDFKRYLTCHYTDEHDDRAQEERNYGQRQKASGRECWEKCWDVKRRNVCRGCLSKQKKALLHKEKIFMHA